MAGVQFNLLPDVKLAYVKAQRSRSVVTTLSMLVTGVAVAILLIMILTVEVVQKKQINNAKAAVTTASKQLKNISNLNKVLTVQNQLSALATLHQQKHISSRLFTYLPEVTPSNVKITDVTTDLTTNTSSITGLADSQLAVNTYVDTLKFTKYTTSANSTAQPAFTSVVESTFALTNDGATFTITAQVAPELFANPGGQIPKLILTSQVTTRSVLDDPSNQLFTSQPAKKTGAQ